MLEDSLPYALCLPILHLHTFQTILPTKPSAITQHQLAVKPLLTLTLFVTGVATDYVDPPFTTDNFAIFADSFYASADFHRTAR